MYIAEQNCRSSRKPFLGKKNLHSQGISFDKHVAYTSVGIPDSTSTGSSVPANNTLNPRTTLSILSG